MKIIKILLSHSKNMSEDSIRAFIQSNFPNEMVRGLEYDDPKTIERALKLLGIDPKSHSAQEILSKNGSNHEKTAASA